MLEIKLHIVAATTFAGVDMNDTFTIDRRNYNTIITWLRLKRS